MEALLILPPGVYVFTDGNGLGGVGVVIVWVSIDERDESYIVQEIATFVNEVFHDVDIPGLESDPAIDETLGRLANILTELAGLYMALLKLPAGIRVTIVHDYTGVGAFMQEQWQGGRPHCEGGCFCLLGARRPEGAPTSVPVATGARHRVGRPE